MKKALVLIIIVMLLSSCDNCKYRTFHIKIGECSFDNQIILFYEAQTYRGELATGNSFYYCTESSKEQQAGVLTSKDGTLRMFVDFNGNEEVLDASGGDC